MVDKKKKSKEKKEIYWIIGALAVLIALFLLFSFIFSNYGKINYQGLTFTKEKLGSLVVYKYTKYIYDVNKELVQYDIYFRGNPKTNKVPISGNEIVYPKELFTYISVNSTGFENCSDSQVALHTLAAFLGNHGVMVRSATPVLEEANTTKSGYVTCETKPGNPVIVFQAGEKTEIKNRANCHTITVSKCEVIPAVEKFMLQSLVDARERNTITKIN